MSAAVDLEAPLSLVPPERPDDDLSTDELGSRIVGLAGRMAAATCRWLLLVAEFDRREGCARWGLASTAAWLMHTCALSRRTAFEHVRVARALSAQPELVTQMSHGRLSFSQVRAITRVTEPADTKTVDDLSQAARHCTIGQLETVVRGMRTSERNAQGTPVEEDYVRTGWTSTSRWRLNARLEPDAGAFVDSALAALAEAEGLTRAEAVVRMAEIALGAVNDSAHPPRALRGEERAAVVVHVDADTLQKHLDAPECSAEHPAGRLADGPGLSWAVLEKLLCQGRLRTVVHDGDGNIQHLGRSHRVVPPRLFRALLHRHRSCCAFPGCTSRAGLQAHHVVHWIHGGRTDLSNLVLLCERHHHTHHEGAFTIERAGRRAFRFIAVDERELSRAPDPETLWATAGDVDQEYAATADDAATPRWDGDRMDRAFAVSCLAEGLARERAKPGAA